MYIKYNNSIKAFAGAILPDCSTSPHLSFLIERVGRMKYYIYFLIDSISDEVVYICVTSHIYSRRISHFSEARKNRKFTIYIKNCMVNKNRPKFKIVAEYDNKKSAYIAEKVLIKNIDPLYNIVHRGGR